MKVAQSCLTLCDPMNCSLPSSSVRGILQARVLEWVTAINCFLGTALPVLQKFWYVVFLLSFTSSSFSSVAQLCPTLCNPMNRSTPGLPVHHQLPEFTQTHIHQVRDAIQLSHPGSSPSPPAPNLSQHQGLFQ